MKFIQTIQVLKYDRKFKNVDDKLSYFENDADKDQDIDENAENQK